MSCFPARSARRGAGGSRDREAAEAGRTRGKKPERGSREAARARAGAVAKYEGEEVKQLTLGFDEAEIRQLESDARAWRIRLEQFDRDLQREPQRIREFYEVRATRIEP